MCIKMRQHYAWGTAEEWRHQRIHDSMNMMQRKNMKNNVCFIPLPHLNHPLHLAVKASKRMHNTLNGNTHHEMTTNTTSYLRCSIRNCIEITQKTEIYHLWLFLEPVSNSKQDRSLFPTQNINIKVILENILMNIENNDH